MENYILSTIERVGFVVLTALTLAAAPVGAVNVDDTPAVKKLPLEQKALAAADAAQKLLREREEEVIRLLKEIEQHVQSIHPGRFEREKMALDGFKKLIPLLKAQATWLLDKKADFAQSLQAYKDALQKAPFAFRQAGELYETYAKEEKDEFFRSASRTTAGTPKLEFLRCLHRVPERCGPRCSPNAGGGRFSVQSSLGA